MLASCTSRDETESVPASSPTRTSFDASEQGSAVISRAGSVVLSRVTASRSSLPELPPSPDMTNAPRTPSGSRKASPEPPLIRHSHLPSPRSPSPVSSRVVTSSYSTMESTEGGRMLYDHVRSVIATKGESSPYETPQSDSSSNSVHFYPPSSTQVSRCTGRTTPELPRQDNDQQSTVSKAATSAIDDELFSGPAAMPQNPTHHKSNSVDQNATPSYSASRSTATMESPLSYYLKYGYRAEDRSPSYSEPPTAQSWKPHPALQVRRRQPCVPYPYSDYVQR